MSKETTKEIERGLRRQTSRNTIHEDTRNDTKHFVWFRVTSWILSQSKLCSESKKLEPQPKEFRAKAHRTKVAKQHGLKVNPESLRLCILASLREKFLKERRGRIEIEMMPEVAPELMSKVRRGKYDTRNENAYVKKPES